METELLALVMSTPLGQVCQGKVKGRPAGERSASASVSDINLGGSDVKESACSAGDLGSMPGSGRSPAEGYGNSLQYSCLETILSD